MNTSPSRRLDGTRFHHRLFALVASLAILPFAACQGQTTGEIPMSASNDSTKDAPLRNLNPNPLRAYKVRILLKDAPGPFESVEGTAQYDVQNPGECGKQDHIAGSVPRITSNEPIELHRESDTEYAGTIYIDRILDEDYYGRGVCKWDFVEARVRLRGASDEFATRFVADIPASVVQEKSEKTTFFWNGYYPRASMTNYATFGDPSLEQVPEEKRGEFFTVTLAADEDRP